MANAAVHRVQLCLADLVLSPDDAKFLESVQHRQVLSAIAETIPDSESALHLWEQKIRFRVENDPLRQIELVSKRTLEEKLAHARTAAEIAEKARVEAVQTERRINAEAETRAQASDAADAQEWQHEAPWSSWYGGRWYSNSAEWDNEERVFNSSSASCNSRGRNEW